MVVCGYGRVRVCVWGGGGGAEGVGRGRGRWRVLHPGLCVWCVTACVYWMKLFKF